MATAWYFDPSKDDGGYFPGVPKRDLEQEEWEALLARLPEGRRGVIERSVEAHPMYRKTPLRGAAREKAEQATADVIGPAEPAKETTDG